MYGLSMNQTDFSAWICSQTYILRRRTSEKGSRSWTKLVWPEEEGVSRNPMAIGFQGHEMGMVVWVIMGLFFGALSSITNQIPSMTSVFEICVVSQVIQPCWNTSNGRLRSTLG